MGAYESLDTAIAGLKIGTGMSRVEGTWKAAETILFGAPVFGYAGDSLNAYNVKQDIATITLDADLVTANVITTTLTIDGVAQAAVATTFITDHDTTMTAHGDALEAAFSGLVVTYTDVTDNRQFTLTYKGVNMSLVASAVTAGGSQAGVVIAYDNGQVFLGIALFTQVMGDNGGYYVANDSLNILTRGQIWVNASAAVNANTAAYVIWDGTSANQKTFTGTSTDNYDVGCRFRKTTTVAGLVPVEVNGQKLDATP